MKTDKKSIKVISHEQENTKINRRTFKDIQNDASGKENLVGRLHMAKDSKTFSAQEKKVQMQHKSVQVGECTITAEDLTSDEPSYDYWKRLAETRGEALNDSIQENDKLKENIEALQEENRICKEMLDESRQLVEVLQEMLSEQDEEENPTSTDTKNNESS
ncbi:hypothetical protein JTB14_018325 [Gonioctena quinquepunctata]|nr:hypothetical protein JTB14_018325 [Gonioctena quinquepunctata]